MGKRSIALRFALIILVGCTPTEPQTFEQAVARYDWDHHTEAEFWEQYPQYKEEYVYTLEAQRVEDAE